jgi:DNA-binding response OmpR family regulator
MKPTILLVDDQPQISKILNDVLTKKGYTTALAFNGEIAYQKALEIKPSLIIMDIMMPVLSGFEAARKIKSHIELREIPIIFLTAKGQDSDKEEAENIGAAGFVTKPFSPKFLLNLVENILNKNSF